MNEAMGICRDVLEAHAENPGALAMLGSLLGHRGDVGESIQLLERAVALNGQVAAWHNNLCSLYRMECRLDEAEREDRAALALAPGQPTLLLNLAKVFMDRGAPPPRSRCSRMFSRASRTMPGAPCHRPDAARPRRDASGLGGI